MNLPVGGLIHIRLTDAGAMAWEIAAPAGLGDAEWVALGQRAQQVADSICTALAGPPATTPEAFDALPAAQGSALAREAETLRAAIRAQVGALGWAPSQARNWLETQTGKADLGDLALPQLRQVAGLLERQADAPPAPAAPARAPAVPAFVAEINALFQEVDMKPEHQKLFIARWHVQALVELSEKGAESMIRVLREKKANPAPAQARR